MTSDRTAASIRRHIDSALRARCVRTWPTDQPGSFEARLTSASPRSATTDLSRSCATRHPSMSAWGLTVSPIEGLAIRQQLIRCVPVGFEVVQPLMELGGDLVLHRSGGQAVDLAWDHSD